MRSYNIGWNSSLNLFIYFIYKAFKKVKAESDGGYKRVGLESDYTMDRSKSPDATRMPRRLA